MRRLTSLPLPEADIPRLPLYDPLAEDWQDRMYASYEVLRRDAPVYQVPNRPVWLVSRYADVAAVLGDWQTFSSTTPSVAQPAGHLAVQDPPRHDELRRLISRAFTPRRIATLEPLIREIARQLVADVEDQPVYDLVAAFAAELPSRVFAAMMGIPPADQADFRRRIDDYLATLSVGGHDSAGAAAEQRIHDAIDGLVAHRRRSPGDDLLTALLAAEIDGERLSDPEIRGFCFNLILAANETTTNLIANGIAILADHAEHQRALREQPDRLPAAVEEMLRYESPVQSLQRTVPRSAVIAQTPIPAGSTVLVLYGSANRDELAFDRPDAFDPARDAGSRHLAFGSGIHFCLGAHLARLEAITAFEVLLPHLDRYEVAPGAREWKTSTWQRSLARLPMQRKEDARA
jgi:cytochrome P450